MENADLNLVRELLNGVYTAIPENSCDKTFIYAQILQAIQIMEKVSDERNVFSKKVVVLESKLKMENKKRKRDEYHNPWNSEAYQNEVADEEVTEEHIEESLDFPRKSLYKRAKEGPSLKLENDERLLQATSDDVKSRIMLEGTHIRINCGYGKDVQSQILLESFLNVYWSDIKSKMGEGVEDDYYVLHDMGDKKPKYIRKKSKCGELLSMLVTLLHFLTPTATFMNVSESMVNNENTSFLYMGGEEYIQVNLSGESRKCKAVTGVGEVSELGLGSAEDRIRSRKLTRRIVKEVKADKKIYKVNDVELAHKTEEILKFCGDNGKDEFIDIYEPILKENNPDLTSVALKKLIDRKWQNFKKMNQERYGEDLTHFARLNESVLKQTILELVVIVRESFIGAQKFKFQDQEYPLYASDAQNLLKLLELRSQMTLSGSPLFQYKEDIRPLVKGLLSNPKHYMGSLLIMNGILLNNLGKGSQKLPSYLNLKFGNSNDKAAYEENMKFVQNVLKNQNKQPHKFSITSKKLSLNRVGLSLFACINDEHNHKSSSGLTQTLKIIKESNEETNERGVVTKKTQEKRSTEVKKVSLIQEEISRLGGSGNVYNTCDVCSIKSESKDSVSSLSINIVTNYVTLIKNRKTTATDLDTYLQSIHYILQDEIVGKTKTEKIEFEDQIVGRLMQVDYELQDFVKRIVDGKKNDLSLEFKLDEAQGKFVLTEKK